MAAVLFQFGLSNVVFSLERLGFFQLLFPFLLSLAIVYGILGWALKEKMGNAPVALISIVISFFVMLYAATNPFIVSFLTQFSGVTLIIATGILMLIVLLGLVGLQFSKDDKVGIYAILKDNWVVGAVLLIIAYIFITAFLGSSGFFPTNFLVNNDIWAVVFFIIVLIIAVKYLGGGEKKPAAPAGEKKG